MSQEEQPGTPADPSEVAIAEAQQYMRAGSPEPSHQSLVLLAQNTRALMPDVLSGEDIELGSKETKKRFEALKELAKVAVRETRLRTGRLL